MKSVKFLKKQAIKAAQLSFKSGELEESVAKKFIKSFKSLPVGEAVPSLLHYYQALKREIGKTTLTIESAVKIPSSTAQSIERSLKNEFKILKTITETSPSILGGVKVRIGDVIFDNSLKAKVSQIGEVLTK